ncbi:MAG TPA: 2-dehydropantoate 2-reductase [Candidatus Dormibacteraeota bacterium]|nr:2-dehydropantoate 2-reductase [Candidatus Dormibacteraeota bacterium]
MKVAILGAGATGGFLGARLAMTGAEIVLIARGPHLKAMSETGLRLIEPDGETTVRVNATDDLGALRGADAVFVTLKAHSVPAIAERLAANLDVGTAVVSAQNGIPWWYFQRHGGELEGTHLETVDPGGLVARTINPDRVIACIVYPATSVVGPGIVRHVEGEKFSLGELDGAQTPRILALSSLLASAGLKAPVQSRVRQELWVKLMGNAVFNPLSVLTRASLGQMAESPVLSPVVRAAMEEVGAVARRLGVEMPITIDQRIRGAARVGAHKTSMLQDLEAGRPMEIDAIVGSVVELAARLDVPVPHLRTIYASVKVLAASTLS